VGQLSSDQSACQADEGIDRSLRHCRWIVGCSDPHGSVENRAIEEARPLPFKHSEALWLRTSSAHLPFARPRSRQWPLACCWLAEVRLAMICSGLTLARRQNASVTKARYVQF
jgi:hypothetical protein